jgi:hypothetical protein
LPLSPRCRGRRLKVEVRQFVPQRTSRRRKRSTVAATIATTSPSLRGDSSARRSASPTLGSDPLRTVSSRGPRGGALRDPASPSEPLPRRPTPRARLRESAGGSPAPTPRTRTRHQLRPLASRAPFGLRPRADGPMALSRQWPGRGRSPSPARRSKGAIRAYGEARSRQALSPRCICHAVFVLISAATFRRERGRAALGVGQRRGVYSISGGDVALSDGYCGVLDTR